MSITLSVRCTREEYMQYCVDSTKKPLWLSVVGMLLITFTALEVVLLDGLSQVGLLTAVCGINFLLLGPLIMPMLRKGEGARRYDASDMLSQAMTLTFSDDSVTVRSSSVEGELPLALISRVEETTNMMSVSFSDELTLYIPIRALSEEEYIAVRQFIQKGTEN